MTFDTHDTFNKIAAVIAEQLHVDASTIKSSATFQDLGADSLDMVQIIMKCEELFAIEIKDEDMQGMQTLSDVVNYINKHRTK